MIGMVTPLQRACLGLELHHTPEAQILVDIAQSTKPSMDSTSARMSDTAF